MVYQRRTTRSTYRRYPSRRTAYKPTQYKTIKRIAKREVTAYARKDHPLQWIDIIFNGGTVNTTPTLHSLVNTVRNHVVANSQVEDWPIHSQHGANIRQATYRITYGQFQFRFQQDVEAASVDITNAVRTYLYSHEDSLSENPTPISDGGDIDQPPNTELVRSMFMDRLLTFKASISESTTDDSAFVPDTKIIKFSKRFNHTVKFYGTGNDIKWDTGDLRWEAQSDSVDSGVQLYGFIRVYYRRTF